jgi:transcriptional regulator with XRE-family HTH domain
MTESSSATVLSPGQFATAQQGTGSRPVVWIGSALLVAGLLTGTTTSSLPVSGSAPTAPIQQWTNNGSGEVVFSVLDSFPLTPAVEPRSLQEMVVALRGLSGLTWDQLARLFGVSRRAIHLWASGGRMNSYHAERLNHIVTVIRTAQARSSRQPREVLLAPGPDGRTLYETLLVDRFVPRGVNAPALSPEQLLGALHDRPTD